jgi:mono/diheme cytochrome c family protein
MSAENPSSLTLDSREACSMRPSNNVLTLFLFAAAASGAASAADVAAGQAKVQQVCADCHDPADWKGQSEAQLRAKISDVVSGKVKHKKKLSLTDPEISDIAAYWAAAAGGK